MVGVCELAEGRGGRGSRWTMGSRRGRECVVVVVLRWWGSGERVGRVDGECCGDRWMEPKFQHIESSHSQKFSQTFVSFWWLLLFCLCNR